MKNTSQTSHLERDLLWISISLVTTVALEYYGFFDGIFILVQDVAIFAAFVAGFFFTSLFTIAPAVAALGELSNYAPLLEIAVAGAAGAVLGDLCLFFFVRDFLSVDIAQLFKRSSRRWLTHTFKHPFLQWLVPVIGALIIASPLPDELGIALMGLSKTRLIILLPVSFVMNFLGIALIWMAAQAM